MHQTLRVIAHPTRIAILRAVRRRELTVNELADALHLRQPATSQHLLALRRANLVLVRSEANRRYYRANDEELTRLRAYLADFWQDGLSSLKDAAEARAARRKTK